MTVSRSGETVIAFECATREFMLRSRVIQALESAVGPDWRHPGPAAQLVPWLRCDVCWLA